MPRTITKGQLNQLKKGKKVDLTKPVFKQVDMKHWNKLVREGKISDNIKVSKNYTHDITNNYYCRPTKPNEEDINTRQLYLDFLRECGGINAVIAAFGMAGEYKFDIKNCVPAPINYPGTNHNYCYRSKVLRMIEKADVSSAYPYEGSKSLPTMRDAKICQGIVEPDDVYEFAFYPSLGAVCHKGEFDTRAFYTNKYYTYESPKFNKNEITILCKKAENNILAIAFRHLYNGRDEDPLNKLRMNVATGMFHENENPMFAHLAAVILARCDKRMLDTAESLIKLGNIPVLINTDSIAWIGKKEPTITVEKDKKQLGAFVREHSNLTMIVRGCKAYQFIDEEGKTHSFLAGCPKEKTAQMKFGDIVNIETTNIHYDYNEETKLYSRMVYDENDIFLRSEEL